MISKSLTIHADEQFLPLLAASCKAEIMLPTLQITDSLDMQ